MTVSNSFDSNDNSQEMTIPQEQLLINIEELRFDGPKLVVREEQRVADDEEPSFDNLFNEI